MGQLQWVTAIGGDFAPVVPVMRIAADDQLIARAKQCRMAMLRGPGREARELMQQTSHIDVARKITARLAFDDHRHGDGQHGAAGAPRHNKRVEPRNTVHRIGLVGG